MKTIPFKDVQPGEHFIFPRVPHMGILIRLHNPVRDVPKEISDTGAEELYQWHAVSIEKGRGRMWMCEPATKNKPSDYDWDSQMVLVIG